MREFKTRREIGDWLTRQLKDCPGYGETKVTVQYQFVEPNPEGCNRSRDLSVNYGRDDNFIVHQHSRPLFEGAQRRFNVLGP
jgi:hypothetical protein